MKNTRSRDSNNMGDGLDHGRLSKETCVQTTQESAGNTGGIGSTFVKSETSSSKRKGLLMLMAHLAGAFTQLRPHCSESSSLSARFSSDIDEWSDDKLQSGSITLQKTHAAAIQNTPSITTIQIFWIKTELGEHASNGLGNSNVTSHCDAPANKSGSSDWIEPFVDSYALTLEYHTGSENHTSDFVEESSAPNETVTSIHGDLIHGNGRTEPETNWIMHVSQPCGRATWWSSTPICVNTLVSYGYDSWRNTTLVSVQLRASRSIFHLSFEGFDSCALHDIAEENTNQKATQFGRKLGLKASCNYMIREEGAIERKSTSNQQLRPKGVPARVEAPVDPAIQSHTETSETQFWSRIREQLKNSNVESKHAEERTIARSASAKKTSLVVHDTGGFACPFYKMYPWKFDHCLTYKLSKMSYVKQHLLRYHDTLNCDYPKDKHAPSNDSKEAAHASHDYQNRDMTAKQKRDIKRIAERKFTGEERWYMVWSILFPGAKKPHTPYVQGRYDAEVLSSIQGIDADSKSRMMDEALRRAVKNGHASHELFDALIERIKHHVWIQSFAPGPSFHSESSLQAEAENRPDGREYHWVRDLSTDNEDRSSFSPTWSDGYPPAVSSSSNTMDYQQDIVSMENPSDVSSSTPKPHTMPSIYDDFSSIDTHTLGLWSHGAVERHEIDWPALYSGDHLFESEHQHLTDPNGDKLMSDNIFTDDELYLSNDQFTEGVQNSSDHA
ncbi:hypothetical protein F4808DRAFT_466599 [Astrocystis sublimbata]|nr:hypothetical protein F4808DRAFT_466599 [Astrocystis sublimbata]